MFFHDRFRSNKWLIGVAGIIALVSTYYLTRQVVDEVVAEKLRVITAGMTAMPGNVATVPPQQATAPVAKPSTKVANLVPQKATPAPVTARACSGDQASRERPIRALFSAWENLDISLYGDQFTADAVQYYGQGNTRYLTEIVAGRSAFMAKLQSVSIERMTITPDTADSEGLRFIVSYAMQFNYKTGRVLPDANDEVYVVRCDAQSGLWKIALNNDRKA